MKHDDDDGIIKLGLQKCPLSSGFIERRMPQNLKG